ncbi:hypothetical protein GCM10011514_39220 [Emticicia aquatilis]|uniref:DUF4402 domain-containing protein n=1 Tax=Emticicia aquatilis TaxID=1537369 RepID=A0A916Z325_9BACT|nr:hypothetical protein [Emticicia aquatilis]GGD71268.1 hypothetical protein GCM10011514_39220 [Emticicia aquatilis]
MIKTGLLGVLLTISLLAEGQAISVSGNWLPSITAISTTGSDYSPSTLTSAANQTLITASGLGSLLVAKNYRISVSKTNTDWHNNLVLTARRTGAGTPSILSAVSASGGTTAQTITNISTAFFTINVSFLSLGGISLSNIPIEYSLSGISVILPVKTYSTTITYTIVEL